MPPPPPLRCMLHATLRKCSQPTVRQCGPDRSGGPFHLVVWLELCPQRNGTERSACAARMLCADFVAFFHKIFVLPLRFPSSAPTSTSFDVTAAEAFELLAFLLHQTPRSTLPHPRLPLQVGPFGVRFLFKWYDISSCLSV